MPPSLAFRPPSKQIPTAAGVYRFLDEQGRVIYVGKAKNLRNRLNSYFRDWESLHRRTQHMLSAASAVKWTVVASELEALSLEFAWIKEFNPRFNVMYRDDKSYPYLAVTMGEEYPRVQIMRGSRRKNVRYFGPYTQVWAIRETMDLLCQVFAVRSCSAGVFQRARAQGRPCLFGYIDKCSAPCVGRISQDDYRQNAQELCQFMAGKMAPVLQQLQTQMEQLSKDYCYEDAARIRDKIVALKKVMERNAVVLTDQTDTDIFALAADELEAAVQVFYVRGGRIRGARAWVVELVEDRNQAGLIEGLLEQVYGDFAGRNEPADKVGPRSVDDVIHSAIETIPREVLVPVLPPQLTAMTAWLSQLRGGKVRLAVPKRGDKRALLATAQANAEQTLRTQKAKRAGDLTHRAAALEELTQCLELDRAPLRIECYDVSHIGGSHRVASMVVFEDGLPRKSQYRRFIIRGDDERGRLDDTAAMEEVLRRRFARLVQESDVPDGAGSNEIEAGSETDSQSDFSADSVQVRQTFESSTSELLVEPDGQPKRFSYRPDLVVVDGGAPQVHAANKIIEELGISVMVVSLAKRLEEIWLPGENFPIILSRASAGLHLLQHLRDESHRFAISHHRIRRDKALTRSVLDQVPGLGPSRQQLLLKQFGSVKRLRQATLADLQQVKGIGPVLAEQIIQVLRNKA